MTSRSMLVFGVLAGMVPTLAWAGAPPAFARLRDQAQSIDSLGSFLERFVGSCAGADPKAACEANARRTRAELATKLYYVVLDGSAVRMLKPGAYDPKTRQLTFEMTPFFEGSGLALTNGAPMGNDSEGRPRIAIEPLYATLPPDSLPMDMQRLVRTQGLEIHIIFKPLGVWALPDKVGGKNQGVRAKFLAVRLTNARSGDEVALRLSE